MKQRLSAPLKGLGRSISGVRRFPLACLIVLAMLAATLLPVSHAYLHLHGGADGPVADCVPAGGSPLPWGADDPCPTAPRTHADHCPLCLHLAQPLLPTADIPGFKAVAGHGAFIFPLASRAPAGRTPWLIPAPRAPPASFS